MSVPIADFDDSGICYMVPGSFAAAVMNLLLDRE